MKEKIVFDKIIGNGEEKRKKTYRMRDFAFANINLRRQFGRRRIVMEVVTGRQINKNIVFLGIQ